MTTLQEIRDKFAASMNEEKSFEDCVADVAMLINAVVPNADNFQLVFDVLLWDWTGQHPSPHPDESDRIALKYSRFEEHQEAVIRQQIKSADEWRKDLEESGMTPMDAIGLAKLDCEMIVAEEASLTAVARHPSHIAIPQQLTQMIREFYRPAKKYNPERTNVLKPLLLVSEVVKSSRSTGEDLSQEVFGRITARMAQVRASTAVGRWVIPNRADEALSIKRFADFCIHHVLSEKFGGDKSAFSSKRGIGLIEDAVWALCLLEQEKENQQEK
jgi:hypothetical protein